MTSSQTFSYSRLHLEQQRHNYFWLGVVMFFLMVSFGFLTWHTFDYEWPLYYGVGPTLLIWLFLVILLRIGYGRLAKQVTTVSLTFAPTQLEYTNRLTTKQLAYDQVVKVMIFEGQEEVQTFIRLESREDEPIVIFALDNMAALVECLKQRLPAAKIMIHKQKINANQAVKAFNWVILFIAISGVGYALFFPFAKIFDFAIFLFRLGFVVFSIISLIWAIRTKVFVKRWHQRLMIGGNLLMVILSVVVVYLSILLGENQVNSCAPWTQWARQTGCVARIDGSDTPFFTNDDHLFRRRFGEVKMQDLNDWPWQQTRLGFDTYISEFDVSANGRVVVMHLPNFSEDVGSQPEPNHLWVWRLERNHNEGQRVSEPLIEQVRHLQLSADGELLSLAGYNFENEEPVSTAGIWATDDWQKITDLPSGRDFIFSPDGQQVAAAYNQAIEIFEVTTGVLLQTIPTDGRVSFELVYSPNGRYLVWFYNQEGRLVVWDLEADQIITEWAIGGNPVNLTRAAFAIASNNKTVAYIVDDNVTGKCELTVREINAPTSIVTVEMGERRVSCSELAISFSSDNSRLAVGALREITIFDVPTLTQ